MGIIPAYAGSTSTAGTTASRRSDHPRIRGEHLLTVSCRSPREGSSPHTRGARSPVVEDKVPRRIIPAYAGSTHSRHGRYRMVWDHPRIRGEHRGST